METPNKQNAQNTLNTLKQCLQNEAYLKAQQIIERDQKYRLEHELYPMDDE